MNEELSSLRFDGVGKCKGGIFDNVNISGTGKIEGSVKCSKFDSSGSAKVFGTTECNEFFTSGLSKVEGNILASKVEISGLLRCTGNINSVEIDTSGIINVEGYLKANENIDCENINLSGILECNGFLNCEEVNISLNGISNFNEVGASSINIKKGHGDYCKKFRMLEKKHINFEKVSSNLISLGLLSIRKYTESKLFANIIEADEISLENSEVKVVRGKNIKIGKGCYVESLEYSESIEIDEDSIVGEIKNISEKVKLKKDK
ncbi:hypothetical protein [Clostridioides difficile]|uniref:hypothetical protein n=1 Tax=Clostridioides difficile TaxID=1496 RepID=UPI000980047B|nr:hypothetical protein [Clostridioides difficile]MCV2270283.1 hypothetical protein [Clostridioides difficile]MDV9711452.1 hypothetical protein [Clostridioides difficile]SJO90676.1 Uncharacterised protein [Clostridioides difficile]